MQAGEPLLAHLLADSLEEVHTKLASVVRG